MEKSNFEQKDGEPNKTLVYLLEVMLGGFKVLAQLTPLFPSRAKQEVVVQGIINQEGIDTKTKYEQIKTLIMEEGRNDEQ